MKMRAEAIGAASLPEGAAQQMSRD